MASHSYRYCGPEPQILPVPPEIVLRILSYIDQICDKRNARLVCRSFASAGLSSLTSTAYFSTSLIETEDSSAVPHFLSSTRDIALHPVVSKYVTRMICDGTQLPTSLLSFPAFRDWWKSLGKKQPPTQAIHDIYTTGYDLERLIIASGGDRVIFQTALEHFVRLKSIVFTDVAADEHSRSLPRPTWPSNPPHQRIKL